MRLPANEALPALLIKILLAASTSYIIKLSPCIRISDSRVMLPPNEDAPPTCKVFSICIAPVNDDAPPTSSA